MTVTPEVIITLTMCAGIALAAYLGSLYWQPRPARSRDYTKELCDGCLFYNNGHCRRFPPSTTFTDYGSMVGSPFPKVAAAGWCGEFLAKPPTCEHSWASGFSDHHFTCSKCGRIE